MKLPLHERDDGNDDEDEQKRKRHGQVKKHREENEDLKHRLKRLHQGLPAHGNDMRRIVSRLQSGVAIRSMEIPRVKRAQPARKPGPEHSLRPAENIRSHPSAPEKKHETQENKRKNGSGPI